jgi:hypothetical protein
MCESLFENEESKAQPEPEADEGDNNPCVIQKLKPPKRPSKKDRVQRHAAPLPHPIYSHEYPCRLPFTPLYPVEHPGPAGAETARQDPSQLARSDLSRDPNPKSQSESAGLIRVSRPDPGDPRRDPSPKGQSESTCLIRIVLHDPSKAQMSIDQLHYQRCCLVLPLILSLKH